MVSRKKYSAYFVAALASAVLFQGPSVLAQDFLESIVGTWRGTSLRELPNPSGRGMISMDMRTNIYIGKVGINCWQMRWESTTTGGERQVVTIRMTETPHHELIIDEVNGAEVAPLIESTPHSLVYQSSHVDLYTRHQFRTSRGLRLLADGTLAIETTSEVDGVLIQSEQGTLGHL